MKSDGKVLKLCSVCRESFDKSDKTLWATRKVWGFKKSSWICKGCALKAKSALKNFDYESLYNLSTGGDDYEFQVDRARKELGSVKARKKFYKKLRKQGNSHSDILEGWLEIGVSVDSVEADRLKEKYGDKK